MDLYVVRHGIAIDREDPKCPAEAERYLTEEGVAKTRQAARGLLAAGATADLLVSSPYVRAVQTAEIFANVLDYPKGKIRQSQALLPGSEAAQIFRELSKEKQASSVFLFGHAPHLDELIAAALGAKHPVTSLKKAGVAFLELKRLTPPGGQLVWLATPKILRKAKSK
jgi:phosphohistidine phosphatase